MKTGSYENEEEINEEKAVVLNKTSNMIQLEKLQTKQFARSTTGFFPSRSE